MTPPVVASQSSTTNIPSAAHLTNALKWGQPQLFERLVAPRTGQVPSFAKSYGRAGRTLDWKVIEKELFGVRELMGV
jgi:hypothetical protein